MSQNLLEVKGLHYSIAEKVLFDNLNFTLQSGQSIVLTGPSGTGKSTFLKIISLLEVPQQGVILFEGKSVDSIPPYLYRREVSYCYQTPQLFGSKVIENVSFPFEIRGEKYQEDLVLPYLNEFQLDRSTLDKSVDVLSGGERQRVALIRNLLFLPKVLLLDEVTSNLDEDNKNIVLSALERITTVNNIASISVTHDTQEIHAAGDKLYILENKEIKKK